MICSKGTSGRGSGSGGKNQGPLTQQQKEAVQYYQRGNNYDLNMALRHDEPFSEYGNNRMGRMEEQLQAGMRETTEDKTLYRGLGEDMNDDLKDVQVGDILTDKGYTSTSPDRTVGEEFQRGGYIAKMNVPRGTRAIDVNAGLKPDENDFIGEKEIILDKGGRYRVEMINHDLDRIELTRIN
jgi:hypothetical protein